MTNAYYQKLLDFRDYLNTVNLDLKKLLQMFCLKRWLYLCSIIHGQIMALINSHVEFVSGILDCLPTKQKKGTNMIP